MTLTEMSQLNEYMRWAQLIAAAIVLIASFVIFPRKPASYFLCPVRFWLFHVVAFQIFAILRSAGLFEASVIFVNSWSIVIRLQITITILLYMLQARSIYNEVRRELEL